eukprot:CAMPEP_0184862856 /NCGR_PEP_ID=MMETSP0580-20130426/8115_1 /TAXON_ID=1118495 /ORGANISM="Dactyliosolen fragilissimus" /LENGTH=142 /DNA_ID=CAMNT_0027360869 /DNA_START=22 /DNA_END=450 /DNA_ORIENTATION=+
MKSFLFVVLAFVASFSNAFVVPGNPVISSSRNCQNLSKNANLVPASRDSETSLMMGRQWNFNEGRGPFGLKKNAEIWNGRMAQVGFTIVLIQELVTGKGVTQGLQDGDPFSYVMLGVTAASILGLTVWLIIQGKDSDIPTEM